LVLNAKCRAARRDSARGGEWGDDRREWRCAIIWNLIMAREKYTVPLKCPTCGREGRANMSDRKSYIIEKDYGTTVDAVPDGIQVAETTLDRDRKYDVVCVDHRDVSALGPAKL
jgi:hypothetical protein